MESAMKRDWSRRLAPLSRERREDFCEEHLETVGIKFDTAKSGTS